jgi:hypothetical protein
MRLQRTIQRFRNQFNAKRRHRASNKGSRRLQLERLETRLAPTVSVLNNFDSIWSGAVPPDTCGAAGPNSYIESGNSYINIYNKSTGASIAGDDLNHGRIGSRIGAPHRRNGPARP